MHRFGCCYTEPFAAWLVPPAKLSKYQLQAELQLPHVNPRPRACDLAEAAGARDGHTARAQQVACQCYVRIAEIRMIGAIEAFEPELDVAPLGEFEIAQGGKVPAENSRAGRHVTAQIAERAGRLQCKRLNVEPLSSRGIAERGGDAGGVRPVIAHRGVGLVL